MSTAPAETRLTKATSFPQMLERFKGEIARALPRHLSADRLARIALTCFRQNPKLAECDPRSVFAAVIVAAQLGLEPGIMGQAYLIPYKTECQLIPGYQGLLDLVRRSGLVQRIEAHVVREGDKFTYKTGLKTILEHEPKLEGTPGALRLGYAVAEFKDGGYHVEVMTEDQINAIRDRSQGYINAKKYEKPTPWETDTPEMWRKTLLRRICKHLPKSPEVAMALSLDDAAAQGRQALTVADAIDGTWQAPVIEVSTEGPDERLAEKSKANVEKIKEKYAQPAEREKNGASQQPPQGSGEPAAPPVAAEAPEAAAPLTQQADASPAVPTTPSAAGPEETGAPSGPQIFEETFFPEPEDEPPAHHGVPLDFNEAERKSNRKR